MSNKEIAEKLDEIKLILTTPVTQKKTAKEAAAYCKVSIETIYTHAAEGLITCSRPGLKNMFFDIADLDEYLDRNKQAAAGKPKKAHKVR